MASTRAVPRLAIVGAAVLLSAAAAPRHASDPPVADAAMRGDTRAGAAAAQAGRRRQRRAGRRHDRAALGGDRTATSIEARMLVYAGARLDATTRNGNYTPLHLAAQTGKTSVIKALAASGRQRRTPRRPSGGATPLHSRRRRETPTRSSRCSTRARRSTRANRRWDETPLMWAAASNRVDALQVLVSRGADLKASSKVEDMPAREKRRARGAHAAHATSRRAQGRRAAGPPAPARRAGALVEAAAGCVRNRWRGAARRRETRCEHVGAAGAAPDTTGLRPRSSLPPAIRRGGGRGDRGPSYGDLIGNKGGLTRAAVRRAPGERRGGDGAAQGRRRRQSGEHRRSYEPAADGDDQRPVRSREDAARARREPEARERRRHDAALRDDQRAVGREVARIRSRRRSSRSRRRTSS